MDEAILLGGKKPDAMLLNIIGRTMDRQAFVKRYRASHRNFLKTI